MDFTVSLPFSYTYFEGNKFRKLRDIVEQTFAKGELRMSYIGDMTNVLLDEIDNVSKLQKYSADRAYGVWFAGKAAQRLEELESDFEYYIEVTEIKKKAVTDKVAATMYQILLDRINGLKNAQDCGKME